MNFVRSDTGASMDEDEEKTPEMRPDGAVGHQHWSLPNQGAFLAATSFAVSVASATEETDIFRLRDSDLSSTTDTGSSRSTAPQRVYPPDEITVKALLPSRSLHPFAPPCRTGEVGDCMLGRRAFTSSRSSSAGIRVEGNDSDQVERFFTGLAYETHDIEAGASTGEVDRNNVEHQLQRQHQATGVQLSGGASAQQGVPDAVLQSLQSHYEKKILQRRTLFTWLRAVSSERNKIPDELRLRVAFQEIRKLGHLTRTLLQRSAKKTQRERMRTFVREWHDVALASRNGGCEDKLLLDNKKAQLVQKRRAVFLARAHVSRRSRQLLLRCFHALLRNVSCATLMRARAMKQDGGTAAPRLTSSATNSCSTSPGRAMGMKQALNVGGDSDNLTNRIDAATVEHPTGQEQSCIFPLSFPSTGGRGRLLTDRGNTYVSTRAAAAAAPPPAPPRNYAAGQPPSSSTHQHQCPSARVISARTSLP
ncbi:unnamed protein product, partial [Amoebophrya sp. A120]|eukprot:GSA120T00004331001.1